MLIMLRLFKQSYTNLIIDVLFTDFLKNLFESLLVLS